MGVYHLLVGVRELSGLVSSRETSNEGRIRGLVGDNTILIGKGVYGGPSAGISPRGSRVIISKRTLGCDGCVCVVVGGPTKIISTARSERFGAIVSVVPRSVGQGKLFPINELSHSARKLLLVASSNSFTRDVASPGGRISGGCITGLSKRVARSAMGTFSSKVRFSSNAGYHDTILRYSGGSGGAKVIAVYRNGCRRIGGVFLYYKLGIIRLRQVSVNNLCLSDGLRVNRYGLLASLSGGSIFVNGVRWGVRLGFVLYQFWVGWYVCL